MPRRLKAKVGLNYPADAATLKKVRTAGGLSKMTREEVSHLNYKRVEPGEFCDDHPKGIQLDNCIARGKIVWVDVPTKTKKVVNHGG